MSDAVLGPTYLRAEDLLRDGSWEELEVTIAAVLPPNTEKAGKDDELIPDPILVFERPAKRMILGPMNLNWVKATLGESRPSLWPGRKITLWAAYGSWGSKKGEQILRTGLRVRVPKGVLAKQFDAHVVGRDLTGLKQGEIVG